jgi:glycosyltransferase involved in cell wall biosynthesis
MAGDLISVVIPTRDRCARLCMALRSALAQRNVELEVIVVDDGSRDDTSGMILRLGDSRVRVVRNDSPEGESGARNRGLAGARGTWIAFLDDDDLWAPDKLERQLRALKDSRRDWVYGGDVVVDDQLRILHGAPPPSPDELIALLPRYNAVPAGASNVIAASELLASVGPFDCGLRRTADWDMWLRLARVGPPACVRRPLVANCAHGGNMSRDMPVMLQELNTLADRYGIPVDRARHYRWAAWTALINAERWQAVRYYAGAIAAGDLGSAGRAAVALIGARYSPSPTAEGDLWRTEAHAWLEELSRLVAHREQRAG